MSQRAEIAQALGTLRNRGVHVVTVQAATRDTLLVAAGELERFAGRLMRTARRCRKYADQMKAQGNRRLERHNSFRAYELTLFADMAKRRAVRLTNQARRMKQP